MGEVALVMSGAYEGLRERLDAEINAFNAAATATPTAGCCVSPPAGTVVTRAGAYGRPGRRFPRAARQPVARGSVESSGWGGAVI
jgi:hypothetical protein